MKLFFKHLLNSIKKRPLQPLILVLTIILAVTVCAVSISLGARVSKEVAKSAMVRNGDSDFVVKVSSTSTSRFMFAEKAESILDGKARVSGIYELPVFLGEEKQTYFASAIDFKDDSVLHLEFIEYQTINQSEINEVALVSKNFLDKTSLSIGDSFTANVLGYQKTYKIVAVSENAFAETSSFAVKVPLPRTFTN
jgi:hypothetical protein